MCVISQKNNFWNSQAIIFFILLLYTMSLLWWLLQIATAPLRWVVEVFEDVSGRKSDEEQMLSMMTLWASSLVKWTVKGIEKWLDDLSE